MKKTILNRYSVIVILLFSILLPIRVFAGVGDTFGGYTVTHVVTNGIFIDAANEGYVYEMNANTSGIVAVRSGTVVLVLNGVNRSGTSAQLQIQGSSNVTLYLVGGTVNTFQSTGTSNSNDAMQAGIYVAESATLTIKGTGTLNAIGGSYCAGIGGIGHQNTSPTLSNPSGVIIIEGGIINATGGRYGAGIGGGRQGPGGVTIISGGTITAKGGFGGADSQGFTGAGIGGGGGSTGELATGGNIYIYGGDITAYSYANSAAIGGGFNANGGHIEIAGGNIYALATGGNASGIGGGSGKKGGEIIISGGTVFAKGIGTGAGIGNAHNISGGSINIFGGIIHAESSDPNVSGVGGGGTNTPTVNITGGSVYSKSPDNMLRIKNNPKNSEIYDNRSVYMVGVRLENEYGIGVPDAAISIYVTHPTDPSFNYYYFAQTGSDAMAYMWLPAGYYYALYSDPTQSIFVEGIMFVNIPDDPTQYHPTANIDTIQLKVIIYVEPTIAITSDVNVVCTGSEVVYSAEVENGGDFPSFQWKVNDMNAGNDSETFTYAPSQGDVITCIVTSNDPFAKPTTATSNAITVTVSQILIPTIEIQITVE